MITSIMFSLLLLSILVTVLLIQCFSTKSCVEFFNEALDKAPQDNSKLELTVIAWTLLNSLLTVIFVVYSLIVIPEFLLPLLVFIPIFILVDKMGNVKTKIKKTIIEWLKEEQ